MDSAQLEFLREYLRAHPELKERVRLQPPSYRDVGGWTRILRVRVLGTGISLELSRGRFLRLFPLDCTEGSRKKSRHDFLRFFKQKFPAWKIVSILARTDRVHRQSGAVLRMLVVRGSHRLAILTVLPNEPTQLCERLLCSAILWWHRLKVETPPRRLLILVPEFWDDSLPRMLPSVGLPLACFKYRFAGISSDTRSTLRQIYPRKSGTSQVRPPYAMFPYPGDAPPLLQRLRNENPLLDLIYRAKGWELSYRGFPIVWQDSIGELYYFDRIRPKLLTAASGEQIEALLKEVLEKRSFPPPHPGCLEYRFGEEKWLESVVLRELHRLAPDLTGPAYLQVPTYAEGQRKILDLLTVTNRGQLVVVELKAGRDLALVFQGLNYWKRVREHLDQGDFERTGYFRGIRLSTEAPRLYLLAPLFEFHPDLGILRKYIREDEISFQCLGINANWKRQFRVLRRFEL